MDWHIRIERDLGRVDSWSVWFVKYENNKSKILRFTEIVEEELPEGMVLPRPSLTMESAQLKELAKSLSEAETLPRDMLVNSKEMQATKYHLEDMRKLVFIRSKDDHSN